MGWIGKAAGLTVAGVLVYSFVQATDVKMETDPELFVDKTVENSKGVAGWARDTAWPWIQNVAGYTMDRASEAMEPDGPD